MALCQLGEKALIRSWTTSHAHVEVAIHHTVAVLLAKDPQRYCLWNKNLATWTMVACDTSGEKGRTKTCLHRRSRYRTLRNCSKMRSRAFSSFQLKERCTCQDDAKSRRIHMKQQQGMGNSGDTPRMDCPSMVSIHRGYCS